MRPGTGTGQVALAGNPLANEVEEAQLATADATPVNIGTLERRPQPPGVAAGSDSMPMATSGPACHVLKVNAALRLYQAPSVMYLKSL